MAEDEGGPPMITPQMPRFDEALRQFQAFITSQGHKAELLWIFRDDVVERWPRTYIRIPLSTELSTVERKYVEGVRRGLGVHLEVFCFLDERPCCYIWIPQDKEEASYRMLSRLKLSVPTDQDCRVIVPVKSRLRWNWLKLLETRKGRPTWADQVPKRG